MARSSECSIAAWERAARSSSASTTVTSTAERAQTSAIPEPISPPPTTPTRIARTLSSGRALLALTARAPRRPGADGRRPVHAGARAAVSEAGGLGFLAAGYRTPDAVRSDLAELRRLTSRPFGLNIFVPGRASEDDAGLRRYAAALVEEAGRLGVELGEPRFDDDGWEDKLALARDEAVPVVALTFGGPDAKVVAGLQARGCAVWVTITTPAEAVAAADGGADALIVQGIEAGGHRGSYDSEAPGDNGLLALLQLVRAVTDRPLVATGGIATGRGVGAVLAAGAATAHLGTAFMRAPEAGTSDAHRDAFRGSARTASRAPSRAARPAAS